MPRILQYCSLNAPDLLLHVNDIEGNKIIKKIYKILSLNIYLNNHYFICTDNMKALIFLPYLLPSSNYTKRKKKNVNNIYI